MCRSFSGRSSVSGSDYFRRRKRATRLSGRLRGVLDECSRAHAARTEETAGPPGLAAASAPGLQALRPALRAVGSRLRVKNTRGCGQRLEIHVRQIDSVAGAERRFLVQADLVQLAVVEDHDRQAQAELPGGREFHAAHRQPAVPHQPDDGSLRQRKLRGDHRRQAETHRLEVARNQQSTRRQHGQVPSRHDLVHAGVGDQHGVAGQCSPQHREEASGGKSGNLGLGHTRHRRTDGLPGSGGFLRRPLGTAQITSGERRKEGFDRHADAGLAGTNPAEHCRVGVHMQRGRRIEPQVVTRRTVVAKVGAEHQHEIGTVEQRVDGLDGTTMRVEAHRERMILGHHAAGRGRGQQRRRQPLHQCMQGWRRRDTSLAREDHRTTGCRDARGQSVDCPVP